ncbi:hypothetical protein BHE74_00039103 [Ensete ventricosum]|nr:hypothetical protein BHE74_00039103 [Ensete ventricosum]
MAVYSSLTDDLPVGIFAKMIPSTFRILITIIHDHKLNDLTPAFRQPSESPAVKVPDLDIKIRRTHEKKRGCWQRGDLDGGKRRSGGYSKRSRGCFGSVALRKKTLAMSKER